MTQLRSQPSGDVRLAAVDLGSNSFHMVVANWANNKLKFIERYRNKVQLASYLQNDTLSAEGINRGLSAILDIQQCLGHHSIDSICCVATNTLRVAKNAQQFILTAEEILGEKISIIPGEEEANLVYLGALGQLQDNQVRCVIDIGGGSTEIIVGQQQHIFHRCSLAMGCVAFKRIAQGVDIASHMLAVKDAAIAQIDSVRQQFDQVPWQVCLGCSGTVKAAFEASNKSSDDSVSRQDLVRLWQCVVDDPTYASLPGLRPDRYDVFPTGLAILLALFDTLAIERMSLSNGALREGVIYQLIASL